MQRTGNFDCGAIACFLITMQMALKFDVDMVVSENLGQAVDMAKSFFKPTTSQSGG